MPLVFGYCRASTSKQVMSTDVQMQNIKAWLDYQTALGEKLEWGDWFIDKATTSKIQWAERSYGALLNSRLKSGDIVVCAKLDRMFRNAREALNVIEDFRVRGVRLVMLDMNVDTGTPNGKLFFTILAGFAEWERSRISERTKEALALRKAQGKPFNPRVQVGWQVTVRLGRKHLSPDYEYMAFCLAITILRDRYKLPHNDIAICATVVGHKKLSHTTVLNGERAARAGFVRHDGKDPFRIASVKESVMADAEKVASKILAEAFRRGGFWSSRNSHLRLPCLSTTSP